ncbi:hypothetical protein SARC_06686 [Sphaeroforma arctica JP610]|uniref:Uncharacterized protein n=1 Tax=Sphaeroforma arctica JP610 TaxID=667725 RepID=A0A0L0FWN3_9EUKA|nr:hypothetical protein SARC_06686 [Sphaeroforma arctica JP610]KNC80971.1 hypothetical protein SARC_06686 [Sphaeroforma arctica JP610]|eukprot:XP_014154873.1 hypothetical protein SARC_06686 [Sphaeroforma arctica JP610]
MMGQPQLPPKEGMQYMRASEGLTSYIEPRSERVRVEPMSSVFRKSTLRPIPQEIVKLHNAPEAVNTTRRMGLFPQIMHAYFVIGRKLVLWDLGNSAFTIYADSPAPITSTTLVLPRPGVMDARCKYLLVVCTKDSVSLVEVGYGSDYALKLWATDFAKSGLESQILQVASTPCGRIFMGAEDGALYELLYQRPTGWLSSKGSCYLHNHTKNIIGSVFNMLMPGLTPVAPAIIEVVVDPERSLLYARYSNDDIQAWEFRPEANTPIRSIGTVTGASLMKMANATRNVDLGFALVSMLPTSVDLSDQRGGIDLLIVTNQGARILMTTTPDDRADDLDENGPRTKRRKLNTTTAKDTTVKRRLVLLNSDTNTPTNERIEVSQALVKSGTCIMNTRTCSSTTTGTIRAPSQFSDDLAAPGAVVCLTTAPVGNEDGQDVELYTYLIDASAQVVDIQELPPMESRVLSNLTELLPSQEQYTQHYLSQRRFLVLTLTGVYTIQKQRPIDVMKSVLSHHMGLYPIHSANDAATLLSLICEEALDDKVKKVAGNSIFELSRTHQLRQLKGLAICIKRLIHPILRTSLVWVPSDATSSACLVRPLLPAEHNLVLSKLIRLRDFCRSSRWSCTDTDAEKYNLEAVLDACIECLHLSDVLNRYLTRMVLSESTELQLMKTLRALAALSIESIIQSQADHKIVKACIAQIAFDCSTEKQDKKLTDLMMSELRAKCPSFFSLSDMVAKQVVADLKALAQGQTHAISTPARVKEVVLPILDVFVTHDVLDATVLTEVVSLLDRISARHMLDLNAEIVRVCLHISDKLKAQSEAAAKFKYTGPGRNGYGAMSTGERWSGHTVIERSMEAQQRQQCYDHILQHLIGREHKLLTVPLRLALENDNEEFLTTLYTMFVDTPELHHHLVRLTPKHPRILKNFLYTTVKEAIDSIGRADAQQVKLLLTRADLFCQYEYQNKNHYKAAEIKVLIADTQGLIDIEQRVTLYREAVVYARAAKASPEVLEFISEAEGRVDLAELQKCISNNLDDIIYDLRSTESDGERMQYLEIKDQLQRLCYGISELYNFAEQLEMTDIQLRLMQRAGYRDNEKVISHWNKIVDDASDFQSLLETIKHLGTAFGSSEYFPWDI